MLSQSSPRARDGSNDGDNRIQDDAEGKDQHQQKRKGQQ